MEKHTNFLLFVILSSIVASAPTKQYRTDYMYNSKTDAFYKLHVESVRQWQLSPLCQAEGAVPMVVNSYEDLRQIHMMMKQYPDLGEYVWVANDGQAHESAEEHPIIDLSASSEEETHTSCEVVTRDGKVQSTFCYQQLPFVCKVEAKNAPYDSQCEVYGTGYRYYQSVGSCYKIPRQAYSWNQAYSECQSEGAHLFIINSEAEREAVYNLTNTERSVEGAYASHFFLAGFRAEKAIGDAPRVFKTIFNQTLEQAGFAVWSPNEPNNFGKKEDCGSVFKNDGKLNDVYCDEKYPFICEKEVQTS